MLTKLCSGKVILAYCHFVPGFTQVYEGVIFHTRFRPGFNLHSRFQTWQRQKLSHYYLVRKPTMNKKIFVELINSVLNSHITLSYSLKFCHFLLIWNWNNKYSPVIPLKTVPDSRLKRKKKICTRFSDRNGTKTIHLGVAQTYMTYIREYPQTFFLLYYNTFNY